MTTIDTHIVIEKYRKGEEIRENITEITLIEFPPILAYRLFRGQDPRPRAKRSPAGNRTPEEAPSLRKTKTRTSSGSPYSFYRDFLDIAEVSSLQVER